MFKLSTVYFRICAMKLIEILTATRTEKGSNFNVSSPLREREGRFAITRCRVHIEARRSQQRRDHLGVAF